MTQKKLRTAILGLTQKGLGLLEAAFQTGLFDIQAAADNDPKLAEQISGKYDCTPFNDYRQLVIQNQLDVLLVGAPSHMCQEYIYAAMKKGIHIVKLLPPALNFEQTAELVRTAKKNAVLFVPANTLRFSPPFCRLRECLNSEDIEAFHLITAVVNIPEPTDTPRDRWLSDPKLAGGGVLLQNCYEIIDQIVLNFGIPQQVYSLNTNRAPDKQQRLSITEDSAVVTMKFSDTLMGNIIASRTLGPAQLLLTLNNRDKQFVVSEKTITVRDNSGNVIEHSKYEPAGTKSTEKMLESFAMSILAPQEKKPSDDVLVDLKNMAVIESAYLSARTAMPEEPAKILHMANTEPTNIWPSGAERIV